jgi:hypothetical protein
MKLLSPRVLALFSAAVLTTPLSVLADDTINISPPSTSPFANLVNLKPSYYVVTLINMLLGGAGVLAFIFLLLGGIQWITAGSDKDGVEKARKKVVQALTGLSVVFSAYAIMYVIRVLFNVNLVQFNITNLGGT